MVQKPTPPASPPPFRPDPRLVDNLEGAQKKRSADKEAVKRALAKRKKDLVKGS